ncbi:MAG: hypothetical protein ACRDOK_23825 [Streptosporangiaceae bacterium]
MDRIRTTHTGSLARPAELLSFLAVREGGGILDEDAYAACLRQTVDDVVRRQVETGIDIVDDGEMGKSSWIAYLYERVSGLEARAPVLDEGVTVMPASRDRQAFPGAYAEIDALEEQSTRNSTLAAGGGAPEDQSPGGLSVSWVVTGPLHYDRSALDRDIANLKSALSRHPGASGFLPVVAPASTYWLVNEYYSDDEEFMFALADVLHEEYQAIVDSGLMLQVDDAVLMHEADTIMSKGGSWEDYRRWAELRVHALNHALQGIPEEHVRYPRVLGQLARPARVRPAAGRRGRSRARGQRGRLRDRAGQPPARARVAGVGEREHSELVAQRLTRLANVVGRENVIGGTDCGFAQGSFMRRVHPEVQWAKLASLAEGARSPRKSCGAPRRRSGPKLAPLAHRFRAEGQRTWPR